jgi:DNA-binding winged helix-turn-helix (wHTH) protein/TolB-like protein/Tfp pilus assembly protein PilF
MSEPRSDVYQFGDFHLDAARRILSGRDGAPIPLTPKVFDTLQYLVEHHGAVLDKDELMRAIWPQTVVEENNLNQSISVLRRVLGEKRGEHRYIATVPGRGYSFVADVRRAASPEPVPEREPGDAASSPQRSAAKPKKRLSLILLVGFGVVVSGLVIYQLWSARKTAGQTDPASATVAQPTARVRSIAVLPFKPLVANLRDESLELGMADTLIVRLSHFRDVRVLPISSVRKFGGLEQDPAEAGRELGVDAVLDGQIQRSGDSVRVTARLIGVGDGRQLWAGQFDEKFTDVFTLQDLISEKVVAALELRPTGEEQRRLKKHYTEKVEAYQLYLNGRFFWEKRTPEGLKRAIEYFGEAIDRDPDYALAYAGLADAHALLGVFLLPPNEAFPKAREAALNALRLDDKLAEAHAALGHIKTQYEYDWAGAEREFLRAIELNPNYPNAHHWYPLVLSAQGRHDEALAEIRRAQELEPFSLFIHANVGVILCAARRYDEAISHLTRVLEMNPDFAHARGIRASAYLQMGMNDEAIAEFEKMPVMGAGGFRDLGLAYALAGRRKDALKEIERLQELSKQHYVPPYSLSIIYAGLGDKDKALEWLEKSYEDRSTRLVWIKVDPRLDSLRSEPRFTELLRRMNLKP